MPGPFPSPPLPAEDLRDILAQTGALWKEAHGKSFFITGGTGFFGSWLLESFAHLNDAMTLGMKAVVLTRDPSAFAKKSPHLADRSDLEFLQGDIRDFPFPEGNFDYLIHAATEASAKLNTEAPHEMLDAIVAGMRRVLDFAAQANVKKLLFTSSGAVYGPQPPDLTHVPEDYSGAPDPLLASSAYGEGKRVAELMAAIHAKQHPCEVKIARCWAFVGPHLPLDSHFAIGNFIRDAMNGVPIKIGGDGTPLRSYLYAADLTIGLWTVLFKAPSGRAYNIGDEKSISISELAHTVRDIIENDLPIEIVKSPIAGQPVLQYVPSTARAASELELKPSIDLREAIKKTALWHGWKESSRLR
jgi:nucleoside-diphosphate-sugar epimerase